MPNESDKNPMQQNKPQHLQAHAVPIDLANKVIVRPANDPTRMSIPTFRTIQQPQQMRVVRMPGTVGAGAQIIQTQIMPQTILKPPITGRSTITVSKSPAAATYLPRVTATLNTIQSAKNAQIRTPTPPSSGNAIPPAFVRTSITPRTSSPTAVLSQQGTTAWVSGTGSMQVQVPTQLIRSTITQNRAHIIQPGPVTVTNSGNNTITANIFGQPTSQQNLGGTQTISVSSTSSGASGQQPTYVATVLPQRPQAATIVYTSQQQQPFIQGQVQRMGIATATANTRQVRPIQRLPTAGIRVNTSTLSIRQNVPGLTPTTVLTTQPRNPSGLVSSTSISSTIPARIIQVQSPQQSGGTQVIHQSNQKILSANVMTLPIIVNNNHRITHSVKNPLQSGIIAHVSKLTSGSVANDGITSSISTIPSNTVVASIQPNSGQQQSNTIQVSQGSSHQVQYTSTQTAQQTTNISSQSGNQIITVSQQQMMTPLQQSAIHQQQGSLQTVVPLAMGSRNANIPIKTITVSTSNSGPLEHRSLTSAGGNLQATTIMPITKIVSQQQIVNQQNISGTPTGVQSTPVFIHTRIPAASSVATSTQQLITVSSAPNTSSAPAVFTSSGNAVYFEPTSVSVAPSSTNSEKTTLSSNEQPSYTVVSSSNVRYTDKMIQSIFSSNLQNNQGSNQQQSVPIRFSPLVVDGGQQNHQAHQIITMSANNLTPQQQHGSASDSSFLITPITGQIPTSPRGATAGTTTRRQNETTPNKSVKKAAKVRSFQISEVLQQMRLPQRQQMSSSVTQITQIVKQVEQQPQKQPVSTTSSPKATFSDRASPSHDNEWSDGSTTVSIPNSPTPEEDDLDALIMSNQFKKTDEDYGKFISKTPAKQGSGIKRENNDQMTPGKKAKTEYVKFIGTVFVLISSFFSERSTVLMETETGGDAGNENLVENVKKSDVVLKKPVVPSLLQTYNQTWKPVHNHFIRYSDVKAREERKINVMDLANQPKVAQRINGWKTHLIAGEIYELVVMSFYGIFLIVISFFFLILY